jgi:hypothetical protein
MSNHFHYWVSYYYKKGAEDGVGARDYFLYKKISVKSLSAMTKDIKNRNGLEEVVINFFSRVDCDCEEKENGDS